MRTLQAPTELRLLRCEAGGQTFALPLEQVRSLRRFEGIRPVESHSALVGWMGSGHREVPIFSAAHLLGFPESAGDLDSRPVALVGSPHDPWGLVMDRSGHLAPLPYGRFHPLPESIDAPFVGVVRDESGGLLVPNLTALAPEGYAESTPRFEPHDCCRPEELSPPAANREQLIVCSVAPDVESRRAVRIGFSTAQVVEVEQLPQIIPVPRASESCLGLVPWRDRFLPLIDAGFVLGRSRFEVRRDSRMLVLRAGTEGQPIAVAALPGFRTLRPDVLHCTSPRGGEFPARFRRGVIEINNQTVVLIDVGTLLGDGFSPSV